MKIANLIFDGQVHTFFFIKQNHVITPLSEMKKLLPSIIILFDEMFCM